MLPIVFQFNCYIRVLRALSVEVDKWDSIIIHLIKGKLNNYVIEKWEEATCNVDKPTLKDILQFSEIQKNLHFQNGTHPRQGSRSQHPFTSHKRISSVCRKCKMKHNSLLHFKNSGSDNNSQSRSHKQINQKLQADQ